MVVEEEKNRFVSNVKKIVTRDGDKEELVSVRAAEVSQRLLDFMLQFWDFGGL